GRYVRLSVALEPSRERLPGGSRKIRLGARNHGDDPPTSQAHALPEWPLRPGRAVPEGGPDRRLARSCFIQRAAAIPESGLRALAGRPLSCASRPPVPPSPAAVSLGSASDGQALRCPGLSQNHGRGCHIPECHGISRRGIYVSTPTAVFNRVSNVG